MESGGEKRKGRDGEFRGSGRSEGTVKPFSPDGVRLREEGGHPRHWCAVDVHR